MFGWIAGLAWAQPLQLGSGTRLVLQPDPTSPTVTVATLYEAGRIDDPIGEEGTAHVVEHLSFEAQPGDGVTRWHELRAAGCEALAWTYDDHTLYLTRCPADRLELLVELELARLADPLAGVDEQAVARALAVVGHEEQGRAQVPYVQLVPRLYEALYPEQHPVVARDARPELAALELPELQRWSARYLGPERATVAFTGAFDPALVLRHFEQAQGESTTSLTPIPPREVPSPRRTLRLAPRTVSVPLKERGLALGWAPPPREVDGLTAELMAEMVGRALAVRWLGDGRVLGVNCGLQHDGIGRPLLCWVEASPDAPLDELAVEMRQVTDGLWSGGHRKFIQKRFRAARAQAELAARGWPDGWGAQQDSWAAALAWAVHRRGDLLSGDLERLRGLKASVLLQQAREHLSPGQAAILVIQPEPAGDPDGEYLSPAPWSGALLPESSSSGVPQKLEVAERTLPGGTRVLAIHRPDAALLYGAVRVRDEGDPLAALVHRASVHEPSTDLLQDVVVLFEGDGVLALAGDEVEPLLKSLRSQVRGGKLSPVLLGGLVRQGEARKRALMGRPDYWAGILPLVATDPSGESLQAMETFSMELDRLVAASVAIQRPDRRELVLVGPLPVDALLQAAERIFDEAPFSEPPSGPPAPEAMSWTGTQVALVDDPGADTAQIVAICALPEGEALPRELAAQALWERLWTTLREERSLVYTPSVQALPDHRLVVALQTPWSTTSEALLLVREALLSFQQGEVGPELGWARQQLALASPALGDPLQTLQFALGAEKIRTAAELEGHLATLTSLEGPDLAAALEGCWDRLHVGISGPADLLEGELGAWPVQRWTPQSAQQAVMSALQRQAGTD